jgi:hypothetical protein
MIMSVSGSRIIEFAARILGNGFLSVAKGLRELEDEDHELFEAVVKLLGIEQSEANILARPDRTFRDLGIDDNHMASIGWPKLIVLCDHVSSGNLRKVLEFADQMPAKDLARIVGQQPPAAMKRMVLLLTADQYQVLANAILAHGGVRSERNLDGLSGKEEALVKALTSKRA